RHGRPDIGARRRARHPQSPGAGNDRRRSPSRRPGDGARPVSPKAAPRAAWGVWAVTLAATVATLILLVLNRAVNRSGLVASYAAIAVISMSLAPSGVLIVTKVRGNAIGWVLMVMGLGLTLGGLSEEYVLHALVAAPGSLPAVGFMGWLSAWTYQLV